MRAESVYETCTAFRMALLPDDHSILGAVAPLRNGSAVVAHSFAWYAYRAHIRAQLQARLDLDDLGFTTFAPTYKHILIRRGLKVQEERYVFGEYGFIRLEMGAEALSDIRAAEGVAEVLTDCTGAPLQVPDLGPAMMRDAFGAFIDDNPTFQSHHKKHNSKRRRRRQRLSRSRQVNALKGWLAVQGGV